MVTYLHRNKAVNPPFMYTEYVEFDTYIRSLDSQLSEDTIYNAHLNIKLILDNCAQLNEKTFLSYRLEIKKKYSAAYANKLLQSLKHYLHFRGERWADEIKRFSEPVTAKAPFTDSEILAILELEPNAQHDSYSYRRWTVLYAISAFTGARLGEPRKLLVQDIDFEQEIIIFRNTKNKNDRTVSFQSMPDEYKNLLKKYCQETKGIYLFPKDSNPNECCIKRAYAKNFNNRCKRLGIIGKNPHRFRHSFCSRMADANVPISVLGGITGQSWKTVERYYQNSIESQRKYMKFDRLAQISDKEVVKRMWEEMRVQLMKLESIKINQLNRVEQALWDCF